MISKMFRRGSAARESAPVCDLASLSDLDDSFHLLKATTNDVAQEAVKTAKVLEDQLKDSMFRFYSTVDSISDIVIIKDGEGRWTFVNRRGQEMFGWYHHEYLNKTDDELIEEFPQFRDMLNICKRTDDVAWESRGSYRSDQKIPHGKFHYHLDTIKTPVFNPDGTRKEIIILGRDVTEIHKKNKRTKACFNALNSASDIIFIVDHQRNIFFCNDMFVKTFGFHDYTEVTGQCVCDVVPGLKCTDELWDTVRQNKTWEDNVGEYQLTVLPMMNGVPDPIYYVCTMKPSVSDQ